METFTLSLVRPCWAVTPVALLRRALRTTLLSLLLLAAAIGAVSAAAPGPAALSWTSGLQPAGLFTYLSGARWAAAAPMLVTTTSTNITCAGNDGTVAATVAGGVPPYTYLWSNGAATATITGLSAGTYRVVVTDATGATATCNDSHIQGFTPITATPRIVGVQCSGDATGSIILSDVDGGMGPYTYLWSNGSTAGGLKSITAGTYTVVITDSNGCTSTLSATVPAAISLLATAARSNATCAGSATGSIDLSVSGGTAPYRYRWSNGATTQDLSGLVAGTYAVTVTDAGGCTGAASTTVLEPAVLRLSLAAPRPSCSGGASGGVEAAVSGGTTPYTYLWSNGATTANLSGVAGGTYTVAVTDANGCTANGSATITESTQITAQASKTDATCYDSSNGTVALAVSGGTAPLAFLWSNGATRQNLSDLAPGTYTVTVTDANGCTATSGATVGEPAQLRATARVMDTSCHAAANGSVDLTASGGTAPYSYLWSNGATTQDLVALPAGSYTVTVTDANGCTATGGGTVGQPTQVLARALATAASCTGSSTGSVALTASGGTAPLTYRWSNAATTQNLSGVSAGTYSVTVTDANGCTATAAATVGEPAQLRATATATAASCTGSSTGSVALAVSGGTAPYTYRWSNGTTTQNLTGVAPGTFSVVVTDANGCTASCSATVGGAPAMRPGVSTTAATCCATSSGRVDLTVSGGTAPYTYRWSNGATTQDLSNVAAGTYTVTITDALGCTATASGTVTQPAALALRLTPSSPSCGNASTGGIGLAVSGGTAPYAYRWSNGATTQDLSGIPAGTYTVTVTDARGCTATSSTSLLAAGCREQHCTLTQGGYGNGNGIICKEPTKRRLDLMADMFTASSLVLGAPGRSLTYSYTSGTSAAARQARQATAQCIIDKLPAGGTAAAFPGTLGNASGCASSFPTGFLRNGRFNNVFVGQTLALALNLRLDNTLAGVPLSAAMTSYATLSCSSPDPGDHTGISRAMPAAVLGNLDDGSGSATVGSLLALANKALGGVAYANGGGNPSISDINAAVAGINELFDDCRIFDASPASGGPARAAVGLTTTGGIAPAAGLHAAAASAPAEAGALAAFPNPFTAATVLTFALPETAKYSLTVYDLKGSEVARVSTGEAQAGVAYRFAVGAGLQEGVYVARLVTATGTQTIRLNLLP